MIVMMMAKTPSLNASKRFASGIKKDIKSGEHEDHTNFAIQCIVRVH
jgi:hypothetical protein